MELTVYRHSENKPFHIELTLDASDFERSVNETFAMDSCIRRIKADGYSILEAVAYARPKAEVVRELVDKIGDAEDVADLLGAYRHNFQEFAKCVDQGDYEKAARYTGLSEIMERKVRARRDAKEVTIGAKLDAEIRSLKDEAEGKLDDITERLINQIQHNAKRNREDYRSYVLRLISSNGEHFEKAKADEVAAIRERIAGYQAMLAKAHNELRSIKNAQVVEFARNDGKIGPDSPVEPSVLAEIEAKAKDNGFFQDSVFGTF